MPTPPDPARVRLTKPAGFAPVDDFGAESARLAAELTAQRDQLLADLDRVHADHAASLTESAQRLTAANSHLGCVFGWRWWGGRTVHSPLCRTSSKVAELFQLQAELVRAGLGADPGLADRVDELVAVSTGQRAEYNAIRALPAGWRRSRAMRRWAAS